MTAFTLPALAQRFDRRTVLRGIAAGTAWGVVVSTALLGLSFLQCGTLCLGQIVEATALSVLTGIVAIGPVAMFRHEAAARSQ